MIESFSKKIVYQMLENDVIDKTDRDYYVYRLTSLLETSVTVLTVLIIAAILRKLDVAIVFMASFMALRRQTGGLHLDSFIKCYVSSVVFCIAAAFLVEYLPVNLYFIMVTAFFAMIIVAIGCVNHPNLDFDDSEFSIIKKRARITIILELFLVVTLSAFKVKGVIIGSIELAVILCSVFMVLAKVLRQEVQNNVQ